LSYVICSADQVGRSVIGNFCSAVLLTSDSRIRTNGSRCPGRNARATKVPCDRGAGRACSPEMQAEQRRTNELIKLIGKLRCIRLEAQAKPVRMLVR
jgi:hypothetical protein